jgi:hypothetical protein
MADGRFDRVRLGMREETIMMIRARSNIATRFFARFFGGFFGACAGVALSAMSALAAAEKLPPCEPDKPIPAGGCMAPKDPVTPLDQLRPAPPLNVPPGVVPPIVPTPIPIPAPAPPSAVVPSLPPAVDTPVIKPPPTGDNEIVKPPPQADSKMPVIKPPKNPEPKA